MLPAIHRQTAAAAHTATETVPSSLVATLRPTKGHPPTRTITNNEQRYGRGGEKWRLPVLSYREFREVVLPELNEENAMKKCWQQYRTTIKPLRTSGGKREKIISPRMGWLALVMDRLVADAPHTAAAMVSNGWSRGAEIGPSFGSEATRARSIKWQLNAI